MEVITAGAIAGAAVVLGLLFEASALLSASATEAQRAAIDQSTGAKRVHNEAEDTCKVTIVERRMGQLTFGPVSSQVQLIVDSEEYKKWVTDRNL